MLLTAREPDHDPPGTGADRSVSELSPVAPDPERHRGAKQGGCQRDPARVNRSRRPRNGKRLCRMHEVTAARRSQVDRVVEKLPGRLERFRQRPSGRRAAAAGPTSPCRLLVPGPVDGVRSPVGPARGLLPPGEYARAPVAAFRLEHSFRLRLTVSGRQWDRRPAGPTGQHQPDGVGGALPDFTISRDTPGFATVGPPGHRSAAQPRRSVRVSPMARRPALGSGGPRTRPRPGRWAAPAAEAQREAPRRPRRGRRHPAATAPETRSGSRTSTPGEATTGEAGAAGHRCFLIGGAVSNTPVGQSAP
jgi:hypothetical protein